MTSGGTRPRTRGGLKKRYNTWAPPHYWALGICIFCLPLFPASLHLPSQPDCLGCPRQPGQPPHPHPPRGVCVIWQAPERTTEVPAQQPPSLCTRKVPLLPTPSSDTAACVAKYYNIQLPMGYSNPRATEYQFALWPTVFLCSARHMAQVLGNMALGHLCTSHKYSTVVTQKAKHSILENKYLGSQATAMGQGAQCSHIVSLCTCPANHK